MAAIRASIWRKWKATTASSTCAFRHRSDRPRVSTRHAACVSTGNSAPAIWRSAIWTDRPTCIWWKTGPIRCCMGKNWIASSTNSANWAIVWNRRFPPAAIRSRTFARLGGTGAVRRMRCAYPPYVAPKPSAIPFGPSVSKPLPGREALVPCGGCAALIRPTLAPKPSAIAFGLSVSKPSAIPFGLSVAKPLCGLRQAQDKLWASGSASQSKRLDQAHQQPGQQCRDRDRKDPCPDHAFHHGPADRRKALCRADAHDRRRDVVRRRNRYAEMRSRKNHAGRGRFRGEPVDRMQLDQLVAEGADDAPAAHRRSGRHGQGAEHLDPGGDGELLVGIF